MPMPKGKPLIDAAKYVALESPRRLEIRKFGFSPKFRKGKFSRQGSQTRLECLFAAATNTSFGGVIDGPSNASKV